MKKYNKNMGIILCGVVIATSTQITTLSYALEDDKKHTTIEKNVQQSFNYVKSGVVEVRNEAQLVSALEDLSIKTIDIKNDIRLDTKNDISIKGDGKEIKGNGYAIKTILDDYMPKYKWLTAYTDTKIDNLKLNGIRISSTEGNNVDIVNNSEINTSTIESLDSDGSILLENVKTNNALISGKKSLVVKSSKIKDSNISTSRDKDGIVKIINTEVSGKRYGYAPISLDSGSTELENVKIINPGDHAIYAEGNKESGVKIRVKGILDIDGANQDAIVLKKGDSSIENPVELYIDGDIKQTGDTYIVKAENEGTYTKVYYDESKIKKVIDKWSNAYYSTKDREGNEPESIVCVNKLVGENAYQTATKVSNEGWDSANDVVIVNSASMVDALSATPFAKYNNAPILLTQANKLNSETKKEILRLKTKNIYIIGGKSVVSNSVINELKSMKLTVQRISGNDRYQTSLEIAKKLPNKPSEIAVVNGETGLPDAVSIAPVAAEKNMPIVLASPNQGTKVFDQYIKDNNIKKSYVIGSEVAVSNTIANKLPNPERLGGIDRNETNALILEKFYTSEKLNNIFVAKDGMKTPEYLIDALTVGVLASKEKSPVVIVGNDLNDKQASLLSKKQPNKITQVGGSGNENAFNKLVNMFKN